MRMTLTIAECFLRFLTALRVKLMNVISLYVSIQGQVTDDICFLAEINTLLFLRGQ